MAAGVRNVDNQYKLSKNVKIAMLYLEDEDPVNAEVRRWWSAALGEYQLSCHICTFQIAVDHPFGASHRQHCTTVWRLY
jgi:hypothetical protein